MTDPEVSRRDFLRRSAIGAGAASGLYAVGAAAQVEPTREAAGLPREVSIATFSLQPATTRQRVAGGSKRLAPSE